MVGLHVTLDFYECDPALLHDGQRLRSALLAAAKMGRFRVLGEAHHSFEPHGFSCVLLLAESHLSIHTWPELRFAAVDIFSCRKTADFEAIQRHLADVLGAARTRRSDVKRGGELSPAPRDE